MRLIVARCEVVYTGRLNAVLPEALRLLMLKQDGSVMVHADSGGFKPQNWMTPPTVIEEEEGLMVVRKRAGASEDRLEIRIAEVVSDVSHDMGEAAALEKEGVERELQELLADQPERCAEGLRLVRREWPTDIGPVDLMCRDPEDEFVAVEIKRARHDRRGGAAHALPGADLHRAELRPLPRDPRRAVDQAPGPGPGRVPRNRLRGGGPPRPARRARAGPDSLRR